jgi:hypothetical protein
VHNRTKPDIKENFNCTPEQAAEKLWFVSLVSSAEPTHEENKWLERWPEGQHYPICLAQGVFPAAGEGVLHPFSKSMSGTSRLTQHCLV